MPPPGLELVHQVFGLDRLLVVVLIHGSCSDARDRDFLPVLAGAGNQHCLFEQAIDDVVAALDLVVDQGVRCHRRRPSASAHRRPLTVSGISMIDALTIIERLYGFPRNVRPGNGIAKVEFGQRRRG